MLSDIFNLSNRKDALMTELEALNKTKCSSFLIPGEEGGHLIPVFDPTRLDELRELEQKKQQLRTRIDEIDSKIRRYFDFLAQNSIKSLEDLRRKQDILKTQLTALKQQLNSDDDCSKLELEIAEIDSLIRQGIEITII